MAHESTVPMRPSESAHETVLDRFAGRAAQLVSRAPILVIDLVWRANDAGVGGTDGVLVLSS